ncbi:hypothetical protein GCM10022384_62660 [Streptomyces marokkonensis]|uniref:CMP/dCMP-type deaminase domain-containing protein n=1 Tax=Streptomyces marokkonensis TaxID=324855 RepID=A0ABP7S8L9_9ACTN
MACGVGVHAAARWPSCRARRNRSPGAAVLVGTAAAQGAYELNTIVAVGDRDRGVVSPCGRCRQVLLDYFPGLRVVVGSDERLRTVSITDLLPESYVWADHQLDAEGTDPLGTS